MSSAPISKFIYASLTQFTKKFWISKFTFSTVVVVVIIIIVLVVVVVVVVVIA